MAGKILKGLKLDIPQENKGLGEYFFDTTKKYFEEPFQINAITEEVETWSQVKQRSVRLGLYLKSIGVKSHDIVLQGTPNNFDNAIPAIAAILIGAYTASFDPTQDISDVKYVISYMDPKVIVVDVDAFEKVEQVLKELNSNIPVIVAGTRNNIKEHILMNDITNKVAAEESSFEPYNCNPSDTAIIFFSSGTTSYPKGICFSHETLLRLIKSMPAESYTGITIAQTTSLFWISGGTSFLIQLVYGCPKVVAPQIPGERMLYLISKYKIPYLMSTALYSYVISDLKEDIISKYDLTKFFIMLIIGSTVNPDHLRKLRKLFPNTNVIMAYGSTECGGGICSFARVSSDKEQLEKKINSCGTVDPNIEIKVVDIETRELLPPNQEGEILVKTAWAMKGYYKMENKEAYDQEGFLKTGDLGYYDEDDYFYVTDRLNMTFKSGFNGSLYKISPAAVESVLLEHPAVKIAVVIGIPHDQYLFLLAACVVLKKNACATEQELIEFTNARVPEYCSLKGGLKIFSDLPRTPSDKIQKRKLKELFLS